LQKQISTSHVRFVSSNETDHNAAHDKQGRNKHNLQMKNLRTWKDNESAKKYKPWKFKSYDGAKYD